MLWLGLVIGLLFGMVIAVVGGVFFAVIDVTERGIVELEVWRRGRR